MAAELPVVVVGEDELCRAVLLRLLADANRGFSVHLSVVAGGAGKVRSSVPKYRTASLAVPHVVLTDLDQAPCAPAALAGWGLIGGPASLLFRFAVREVESWLLADASGFAAFVGVPVNRVPGNPEGLVNPKQTLINLARRSRNKRLVAELVPSTGSRVSIGPLYNERLTAFVRDRWNVGNAAVVAPNLSRLLERLQEFMA